ncbi:MAG: TIGR02099 family protein [Piscirickettsiaceae bacterium]|nr:MAG: TIGR02099 family protein [Piscirickettsiaceae bacterium]
MSKVRLFGHSLLWVFTVSVVVLAILLAVARFFITQVPAYKNDLESYLSNQIGGQVSIGKMAARIDGFTPQLSLKNVTLDGLKQQTNTLRIGEIRLSLNPWGVLKGVVTPSKITIIDTYIAIKRFADGHVSIVGFSNDNNEDSSSGDFSWLLENGSFEVIESEIVWQDEMREEEDVSLENANIIFQNVNQQHTLRIAASLPRNIGGDFILTLDITGDVLSTNNWHADGYLKTEQINLSKVLSRLDIDEFDMQQGAGDIELWSTWEKAQLTHVQGNIQVSEALLVHGNKELNIKKISSKFDWKKRLQGWRIVANEFTFSTNGFVQQESQFSLQYEQTDDENKLFNLTTNVLNLDAFSNVLQHSGLLAEKHRLILKKLNLEGDLKDSYLSVVTEGERVQWAACGHLKAYSSNSIDGGIPAIKNFAGTGCASDEQGWFDVETHNGSVYFESLFRDPLLAESLTGRFTWLREAMGWRIISDEIQLDSPHISTASRINIHIPSDGQSAYVDLQTKFGSGDAKYTAKYLPVGIMGEGVVHWLDNAFKDGKTTGGGVLLKGSLTGFPYRDKKGLFQVLFDTQGVGLHYADKWPDVADIQAEVEFKNQGMKIIASKGNISGNAIEQATVEVKDLENDHYLTISGNINDEIGGLYRFFRQSPLNNSVRGLLENSRVAGKAIVDIGIKIPLRKGLEVDVSAHAKLFENRLLFPDIDIAIENIKGDVFYEKSGMKAKGIKASVLGRKVRIDILPDKDNTVIMGLGQLDMATLSNKYPADVWKHIKGISAVKLTVKVPRTELSANSNINIVLETKLKGISVTLPEPIGKAKTESIAFKLHTVLGKASLPVNLSYDNRLQGAFLFTQSRSKKLLLTKADIHLGGTAASLPTESGVRVSGKINELDLLQWQQALGITEQKISANEVVNQVDLEIGKLVLAGMSFEDIVIKGLHKKSAWKGYLKTSFMAGNYVVPDDIAGGALVSLKLDKLYLPETGSTEIKGDKPFALEPLDFPNLNLSAKQFFINKQNLGTLSIKLRRKTNGLIIQQLNLISSRDKFTAKGAWEKGKSKSITGLSGHLKSKSLGGLLKDTGLLKDLEGASSDIYFDLNWPNAPHEFSKSMLNGFATVKSKKGRLLNIEPGVGRVFGLLGIDTLKRRLQLDFSDLVRKGLSFDKIKGRFIIVNGDARTDNLYVESPSSRLDIAGRIGLGKEDYDQLITVTPKSTESLPLAGAIAGGPLLGAAIYIVQKVAGKTVNKLAGYQYHVTGSWNDPKIKQLSQPGGNVFGIMGDFLSPVFGINADDEETLAPAE